jgi:hypothetical protein
VNNAPGADWRRGHCSFHGQYENAVLRQFMTPKSLMVDRHEFPAIAMPGFCE